jgi:hypothetical protein
MSDGALNTTGGEAAERREPDPPILRRVLQLGAAGRGRAEIAAALGMSPTVLAARGADDAVLAAALVEAAGLAEAWWEARAREACAAGRFNFVAACTREMRRRFGEGGPPAAAPQAAASSPAASPPARRGAVYLIPCNGRVKPHGTCPCTGYENDAEWRAQVERYYAEHPRERLGLPDPDEDRDNEDDCGDEEETYDDERF